MEKECNFYVQEKIHSLTNFYYLEIISNDFSLTIYFDNLIRAFQSKNRLFKLANDSKKKYINFKLEDHKTLYEIRLENTQNTRYLFYKKKKNIEIIDKSGKKFEYKIYRDEQLLELVKKHFQKETYLLTNNLGENIKKKDISKYDSIKIKYNDSQNKNFVNLFQMNNEKITSEKYSLTLNFDNYFNVKDEDFSYIETNERKELEEKLLNFVIDDESKIFCLTGISGAGKSITLLHFLKNYNKLLRCYFNIRELFKFGDEELLLKEAFKLFTDNTEFLEAIDELKKKNFKNTWDKILFILEKLSGLTKIILVFDQYKTNYDPNFTNITYIYHHFENVKIILCSSINDNNLRTNVIETNWLTKINNTNIFKFYYIENNLVNLEESLKDNNDLHNLMKDFDYSPKIVNKFKTTYNDCSENNKQKFIKEILDFYINNIDNFYIERKIHIYEKYKIIVTYIENEELLNIRQFIEILDFLPLKYIRIIKKDNLFLIKYAFPFLYYPFRFVYLNELNSLARLNISNSNKNSQIGNYIDDLVNLKFDILNKFEDKEIKKKIIVDRISGFQKVFQVITENNYGSEYKLFFISYFNKIEKEFDAKDIFDGNSIIFIEQYFQGKDFDGGLLIPFNDIEGNFELYIYQTSVNKRDHFTRTYINSRYQEIKKEFEEKFGIKIVNGYFSYILLFENPDIRTVTHCQNYYLNYIYYSLNQNEFVDSNNKKISQFLTRNSLIYDSSEISDFSNLQKQFDFFKNCLMYNKTRKKFLNFNASKNTTYLNKKIKLVFESDDIKDKEKLESIIAKSKNVVNEINMTIKNNNNMIEKIKSLDINQKEDDLNLFKKDGEIKFKTCNSLKEAKKNSNEYSKQLKYIQDKFDKLKNILIYFNQDVKEFLIFENEEEVKTTPEKISYNIKNKIKYQSLPEYIGNHLKGYSKYRELGNTFFFGLNVEKKLPYCFLFDKKGENGYKYLIYYEKENIIKINLKNGKNFDENDSNDYINDQMNNLLNCHYIKLK